MWPGGSYYRRNIMRNYLKKGRSLKLPNIPWNLVAQKRSMNDWVSSLPSRSHFIDHSFWNTASAVGVGGRKGSRGRNDISSSDCLTTGLEEDVETIWHTWKTNYKTQSPVFMLNVIPTWRFLEVWHWGRGSRLQISGFFLTCTVGTKITLSTG